MKEKLYNIMDTYIKDYEKSGVASTKWGEPLIGFADAHHPYILDLKSLISDSHGLPSEVMHDARIVLTYFLPFTKALAQTNKTPGDVASPEWALAYEETNTLLANLNGHLITALEEMGYRAAVSPDASIFDRKKLISHWSHRHFARAAGLGTFGINNMLITKHGCCGRYSTIITNLDVEPDKPLEKENCFFKQNGTCGACVKHCPSGALTLDQYDRKKCYEVCTKNAGIYTDFGHSYTNSAKDSKEAIGSEVCGKCVANAPCAFHSAGD